MGDIIDWCFSLGRAGSREGERTALDNKFLQLVIFKNRAVYSGARKCDGSIVLER